MRSCFSETSTWTWGLARALPNAAVSEPSGTARLHFISSPGAAFRQAPLPGPPQQRQQGSHLLQKQPSSFITVMLKNILQLQQWPSSFRGKKNMLFFQNVPGHGIFPLRKTGAFLEADPTVLWKTWEKTPNPVTSPCPPSREQGHPLNAWHTVWGPTAELALLTCLLDRKYWKVSI